MERSIHQSATKQEQIHTNLQTRVLQCLRSRGWRLCERDLSWSNIMWEPMLRVASAYQGELYWEGSLLQNRKSPCSKLLQLLSKVFCWPHQAASVGLEPSNAKPVNLKSVFETYLETVTFWTGRICLPNPRSFGSKVSGAAATPFKGGKCLRRRHHNGWQ